MAARTIGFAVADEDRALLDTLVAEFGGGNRSEFLRQAMRRMRHESQARRLMAIREQATASPSRSLTPEEIDAIIYG